MLKTPLFYYGGKLSRLHSLLEMIPPHRIYVEVFGGSAALLIAKEPSEVEVYNDIDLNVVNFFRVLREPAKFVKLYNMLTLTPVSLYEFTEAKKTLPFEADDVMKAYKFFIVNRQSFSAAMQTWARGISFSIRDIGKLPATWLNALTRLSLTAERLMRVQIDNVPFERAFELYDTEETFFYCDPPYVAETRRSKQVYPNEMSDEDHKRFLSIVNRVKGKVLISGYDSELYNTNLSIGWQRKEFSSHASAAGRTRQTGYIGNNSTNNKQQRVEVLWWNY